MELKNLFAQDKAGKVIPNATCYLYLPGTTTPVGILRDAAGQPLANPFQADGDGLIQFAAPNGRYDLRIVSGGRDYRLQVQCNDLDNRVLLRQIRIASAGATLALNVDHVDSPALFDITLDQPSCQLSFSGSSVPEGFSRMITLVLRQGSGANQVVWPASIDWPYQRSPVLAYEAGAYDLVSLLVNPADPSRWIGSFAGGWKHV